MVVEISLLMTVLCVGLVVTSGWLMMKGTSRFLLDSWQRRWVVLRDDCIAYYYTSCDVSHTHTLVLLFSIMLHLVCVPACTRRSTLERRV